MQYPPYIVLRTWAVATLGVALFAPHAWADKPDDSGQSKHRRPQEQRMENRHVNENQEPRVARQGSYFEPRHHQAVRDIYGPAVSQGRCPPGLAKKGNGCLPPGQAKRWAIGQPLPSDMVRYSLPPELQRRLGPPPAGYKYVRAASDILLIAVGTRMVVDAIEDLGGL